MALASNSPRANIESKISYQSGNLVYGPRVVTLPHNMITSMKMSLEDEFGLI